MKRFCWPLTVVALSLLMAFGAHAQTAAPTLKSPLAASATAPPVGARTGLPRGAKTVFAFKTNVENRPIVLHGWRVGAKEITLDVFGVATARSKTRKGKARVATRLTRLNRVVLGRMESGEADPQVSVATARLGAKGGSVLVMEWPYFNVSGSYSYVPLLLVTLPDGLKGRAVVSEFRGESEPGGGEVYEAGVGSDGNFALRKKNYERDAGTANYTPYNWNGKSYVAGERGETVDIAR